MLAAGVFAAPIFTTTVCAAIWQQPPYCCTLLESRFPPAAAAAGHNAVSHHQQPLPRCHHHCSHHRWRWTTRRPFPRGLHLSSPTRQASINTRRSLPTHRQRCSLGAVAIVTRRGCGDRWAASAWSRSWWSRRPSSPPFAPSSMTPSWRKASALPLSTCALAKDVSAVEELCLLPSFLNSSPLLLKSSPLPPSVHLLPPSPTVSHRLSSHLSHLLFPPSPPVLSMFLSEMLPAEKVERCFLVDKVRRAICRIPVTMRITCISHSSPCPCISISTHLPCPCISVYLPHASPSMAGVAASRLGRADCAAPHL